MQGPANLLGKEYGARLSLSLLPLHFVVFYGGSLYSTPRLESPRVRVDEPFQGSAAVLPEVEELLTHLEHPVECVEVLFPTEAVDWR